MPAYHNLSHFAVQCESEGKPHSSFSSSTLNLSLLKQPSTNPPSLPSLPPCPHLHPHPSTLIMLCWIQASASRRVMRAANNTIKMENGGRRVGGRLEGLWGEPPCGGGLWRCITRMSRLCKSSMAGAARRKMLLHQRTSLPVSHRWLARAANVSCLMEPLRCCFL